MLEYLRVNTGKDEVTKKESLYERLLREKVPIFISTRIPYGTSYRGREASSEEQFKDWYINGWSWQDNKRNPPSSPRPPSDEELILTRRGNYITVEFSKECREDNRWVDRRGFRGLICYNPDKKTTEDVWDDLKKNPHNAYQLIDPELLKLISLPPDLKIILGEQIERREETIKSKKKWWG